MAERKRAHAGILHSPRRARASARCSGEVGLVASRDDMQPLLLPRFNTRSNASAQRNMQGQTLEYEDLSLRHADAYGGEPSTQIEPRARLRHAGRRYGHILCHGAIMRTLSGRFNQQDAGGRARRRGGAGGRCTSRHQPVEPIVSIEQVHRIASTNYALAQHRAIDTRHSLMALGHVAQNCGI